MGIAVSRKNKKIKGNDDKSAENWFSPFISLSLPNYLSLSIYLYLYLSLYIYLSLSLSFYLPPTYLYLIDSKKEQPPSFYSKYEKTGGPSIRSTLQYLNMLLRFLGDCKPHTLSWFQLEFCICFLASIGEAPMAGGVSVGAIGTVDSSKLGPLDETSGGRRHELVCLHLDLGHIVARSRV